MVWKLSLNENSLLNLFSSKFMDTNFKISFQAHKLWAKQLPLNILLSLYLSSYSSDLSNFRVFPSICTNYRIWTWKILKCFNFGWGHGLGLSVSIIFYWQGLSLSIIVCLQRLFLLIINYWLGPGHGQKGFFGEIKWSLMAFVFHLRERSSITSMRSGRGALNQNFDTG